MRIFAKDGGRQSFIPAPCFCRQGVAAQAPLLQALQALQLLQSWPHSTFDGESKDTDWWDQGNSNSCNSCRSSRSNSWFQAMSYATWFEDVFLQCGSWKIAFCMKAACWEAACLACLCPETQIFQWHAASQATSWHSRGANLQSLQSPAMVSEIIQWYRWVDVSVSWVKTDGNWA